MNLQELDRLLEKYYEGATSEVDELRLVELLSSEGLPESYSDDRLLLTTLFSGADIPDPDSGFEARILQAIDNSESRQRVVSIKRRLYTAVSVAAAILVIISSYFILNREDKMYDTYDDPILAYNATVQVLYQVSAKMNSGVDALDELSVIEKARNDLKEFSEQGMVVSREMRSLKYLEKGLDLLDIGSQESHEK